MRKSPFLMRLRPYLCMLLFLACVYFLVDVPSHGNHKNAYGVYVARHYMPVQRKLSGKWPTSLNGVTSEFHRNYFRSLEIVKSDDKSCHYVLHLRGYYPWTQDSLTCDSTLNGGSCHW